MPKRAATFIIALFVFSGCSAESAFESAEEAFREKRLDKAAYLYEKAANIGEGKTSEAGFLSGLIPDFFKPPKNPQLAGKAYERLAEINAYHLFQYDAATNYLKKAISACENPEATLALREKLAEIYYVNIKDYQQAIVEYQRLLANRPTYAPNNDLYLYRVIESYLNISKYDQARIDANEFFEKYKNSPLSNKIELIVAQSYDLEQNKDAAIVHYERLMNKLDGQSEGKEVYAEAAFLKGNIYNRRDNCDEAEAAYQKALKYHPHPETVREKAVALREKCRRLRASPETVEQYRRLMEIRAPSR